MYICLTISDSCSLTHMTLNPKLTFAVFIALSVAITACVGTKTTQTSGPNSLTREERKAGWKLLFNGATTEGWTNYNQKTIDYRWIVQDDALHLSAKGAGDILSKDQFQNFELSLEWKISPKGNSGIFYGVKEDASLKRTYMSGLEYQVLDNEGHQDGKKENHRTGSLYDMITPAKDATKPIGEWNQTRIVVQDKQVTHYLNGEKLLSFNWPSVEFDSLVVKSKFKGWPAFGKTPRGKIALQDHGDPVWYRAIKIRPL